MKLIVDIPENLYSYISKEDAVYFPDDGGELFEAVRNGTSLKEELEKIKAEFEDRILLNQTVAIKIIEKHISELKGE